MGHKKRSLAQEGPQLAHNTSAHLSRSLSLHHDVHCSEMWGLLKWEQGLV